MEAPKEPSDKEKFAKLLQEMEWLDEPGYQTDRTPLDILKEKVIKNPFVPIGCLATMVVLGLGIRSYVIGASKRKSQLYMRWRVGLQGATVAALACGVLYEQYAKSKNEVKPKDS